MRRRPEPREEEQLGLWAYCHRCAEQSQQSLLRLRRYSVEVADDESLPLEFKKPSGPKDYNVLNLSF